jgi:hypothetical protein
MILLKVLQTIGQELPKFTPVEISSVDADKTYVLPAKQLVFEAGSHLL